MDAELTPALGGRTDLHGDLWGRAGRGDQQQRSADCEDALHSHSSGLHAL